MTRIVQITCVCRRSVVIHAAKSQASETPVSLHITILRCRAITILVADVPMATTRMVATTAATCTLRYPNITATVATKCLPTLSTIPVAAKIIAIGIATAT